MALVSARRVAECRIVLAAEYDFTPRTALRRNEACHGLESATMEPDMPLRPAVS